jgi:hypothetical protein
MTGLKTPFDCDVITDACRVSSRPKLVDVWPFTRKTVTSPDQAAPDRTHPETPPTRQRTQMFWV